MGNKLYYGDNLAILREHVPDESVDLVYLDPPFNSNATYNVLFRAPSGEHSKAQIEAFEDTWHWNEQAEDAYWQVLNGPAANAAKMLEAMRVFLGENDMMAYLAMMAVRLIELHRALKPTGSLYLHCDPTASHYLKILLDGVFGNSYFRSEVIWRRCAAHNKLSKQYGPIHDTILFYSKSSNLIFHPATTPYTKQYLGKMFRFEDEKGAYRLNELTGQGVRKGDSGKPWRGYDPTPRGRHWAIPKSVRAYLSDEQQELSTQEQLEILDQLGLIVVSKEGRPTYKQYKGNGTPYQDIWAYQAGTEGVLLGTDACIDADTKWLDQEEEKLPYPTQKPVGLLERIIRTSSHEGDVVLDPFCGCGTTIHAAQKLNRQWIGIDITHLAIALVGRRLRESFRNKVSFTTIGVPKDLAGAQALAEKNKFEFERWAVTLIPDAQPYRSKGGGDAGVDGLLYFKTGQKGAGRKDTGKAVISVKGGKNIKPSEVRDLKGTVEREKALIGLFLTLYEPSRQMLAEAAAAGFVETEWGRFPKIQILTIDALMNGERARVPGVIDSSVYKQAAKEDASEGAQEAMDF